MSKRDKDKKDSKGSWWEDGDNYASTWPKGGADKAPRGKYKEGNPGGFGLSWFKRGPTRGMSSTGKDRKGGWFFGGKR